MRRVIAEEWNLENLRDDLRRHRLLNPLPPESLLEGVLREGERSAVAGLVTLQRQPASDPAAPPGYFRTVAQIPVTETTFDLLFNGRSGYRAQYYLSPEEGEAFNRAIVDGFKRAVVMAYERDPIDAPSSSIEESLHGPYSKIWVFKEKDAFNEAEPETLNPPRWVENNSYLGRRAPLPRHHRIDLKGTFIKPGTGECWIDPLKLERSLDLHRKGYT